jgi:hypothetical protein
MGKVLDWNRNRDMWIRALEKQTGQGLDHWNERVRKEKYKDEKKHGSSKSCLFVAYESPSFILSPPIRCVCWHDGQSPER